jgi:hypothetical protein
MYRKISLLFMEDSGERARSDLFSSSNSSDSSINFPAVSCSEELISALFGEASPLLINLALSLLLKFILKSKVKLTVTNSGGILGMAAMVGYKIFYD